MICDRGLMDASAYIDPPQWLELLEKLTLREELMCEDRYHHVVHMVSQGPLKKWMELSILTVEG